MAKIKRVVQPNVNAPNLFGIQQRINIPRDAFGQNVSRATQQLGASIEFSADIVGDALIRNQHKQDVIDANAALSKIELENFNDNEAAKDEAIKAGRFSTFASDRDADFKKQTDIDVKGLSPGAAAMVSGELVSMRTSQAISNSKWANTKFIEHGRNQAESTINSIISTGGALAGKGNIDHIPADYERIKDKILVGVQAGFFGLELPDDLIKAANRGYSKGIANAMMDNNPVALRELIESGGLLGLTEQDKKTLTREAIGSFLNLDEKAFMTKVMSELSNDNELTTKFQNGTLTYNEVDRLAEAGEIGKEAEEYFKSITNKPESVVRKEAIDKKVFNIETLQAAKEIAGTAKAIIPKPSLADQISKENELYTRYLKFEVANKDGVPTIGNNKAKISEIVDLQNDIFDAANKGLITRAKATTWTQKLIPSLIDKIDSKHFKGSVILNPFSKGMIGGRKRDKTDIYSAGFNFVADAFENILAGKGLDLPENRVKAFQNVVRIAEEQGIDRIEDPDEKRLALFSIGRKAVVDLYKELFPQLASLEEDKIPNFVIEMEVSQPSNLTEEEKRRKQELIKKLAGG